MRKPFIAVWICVFCLALFLGGIGAAYAADINEGGVYDPL